MSRDFISLPLHPDWLWPDPPSLLSSGYQGTLSLGIKWLGHETGHSPPSSADVRDACICIPVCLHGMVLS